MHPAVLVLLLPPVLPTPPELEVCILQAELCVVAQCSDAPEREPCAASYEDCSYDLPEAHIDSCRVGYVWCVLEESEAWSDNQIAECKAIRAACPAPLS